LMKTVIEKALSLVGQGYIYGAKGQTCAPAFRQQQAQQYPEQADNILNTGAKWDGKPVWDCAQLTRAVAKAASVTLVSGATSQWEKTDWAERGEISTIPEGKTVFVFRQNKTNPNVMQHTGVALGDGTCVHARGTAYGVVRQTMAEHAWTHWAMPRWGEPEKEDESMYKAYVMADTGSTVNMRSSPARSGSIVMQVTLETVVDVLGEDGSWSKIREPGGKTGWMMTAYLQRKTDEDAQETGDKAPDDASDVVTVFLPRSTVQALLSAFMKAVDS